MSSGPEHVGGYELIDVLRRGGQAVVHRARQLAFKRDVALKILTATEFTGDVLGRFERECESAGGLSWHPHIVAVYDAGTTDNGLPYLAMEYLEAGSLADRIAGSGRLSPAEAVSITIQVAGALETAHRAGLLHRDIKPANILVGPYGEAKLADFGIASAQGGATLTATGMLTATVAHAAPEVLAGERASVRSDVYSLGSTLYELLSGSAAFVREGDETLFAVMARVATEPVPDLRQLGVPDDVAAAVGWAMAKDAAERPPTAASFGEALQEVEAAAGRVATDMRLRDRPAATLSQETVAGQRPAEAVATEPAAAAPGLPPTAADEEVPDATAGTRHRGRRRALFAALGALAVLASAGAAFAVLGGGDSGDPTTATTATGADSESAQAVQSLAPATTAATTTACRLLPEAEAEPPLGTDLALTSDEVDGCGYESADGAVMVALTIQPGAGFFTAAQARLIVGQFPGGADAEEIDGVGDLAFLHQLSVGGRGQPASQWYLHVLADKTLVTLALTGADSPDVARPALIHYGQVVAARV